MVGLRVILRKFPVTEKWLVVGDDVHIAQVSRIVAATEIRGFFGCRALLLQFCVRGRRIRS